MPQNGAIIKTDGPAATKLLEGDMLFACLDPKLCLLVKNAILPHIPRSELFPDDKGESGIVRANKFESAMGKHEALLLGFALEDLENISGLILASRAKAMGKWVGAIVSPNSYSQDNTLLGVLAARHAAASPEFRWVGGYITPAEGSEMFPGADFSPFLSLPDATRRLATEITQSLGKSRAAG